MKVYLA